MFSIEGSPGPLSLHVVPALNDADPEGAGASVWSWTGTAEDIRLAMMATAPTYRLPATCGAGTVLPTGTNYLVFSCAEADSQNYYAFWQGSHLHNGDGGLRHDHDGVEWVAGETEPLGGVATFVFDLYHSPNGDIRICTDGIPDSEPWMAFPYPDDPFRTVAAPGEGLFTVIVDYRNTTDPSRDGTHLDTIMIDGTPPVVHNVGVLSVDRVSRGVLLDLNVTDAATRVANMSWRFDDGPWQGDAFRRKPFLFCPPSFSTMTWIFRDAAANEAAPAPFSLPVDMSAPTLFAEAESGAETVASPNIRIAFDVHDDTAVAGIRLREARTGADYGVFAPEVQQTEVELPKLLINREGEEPLYDWVDGAYCFAAVATDTSGNDSATVAMPLTLDREPPVLDSLTLCGAGGEAPVTNTNLVLDIQAKDNIGPMAMRWRWAGGAWSDWRTIADGRFGLHLAGALPLPSRYDVDVQVRDRANWTVGASCGVGVNHPPETPACIRPEGGCGDPPFLFGSDFRDPDLDAWGAAQYAIRLREEVLLDTGPLNQADRYIVPKGWLVREEKYAWRCRYFDAFGAVSGWSEWLSFDLYQDTDGDGIPDDIESAYGTDPNLADSDEDGIPDGLEDLNANGVVDAGETNPRVRDSDGDGPDDGAEDLDLDARLDPAETSPGLRDTDGDRADDLHEQRAGTDPRDPAASFRFTGFQRVLPDGRHRLVWQARGGQTYSVRAQTALGSGQPQIAITNLTAVGGVAPWYVVPLEWTEPSPPAPSRYYSIRLEP